jgi:hypothetical protein
VGTRDQWARGAATLVGSFQVAQVATTIAISGRMPNLFAAVANGRLGDLLGLLCIYAFPIGMAAAVGWLTPPVLERLRGRVGIGWLVLLSPLGGSLVVATSLLALAGIGLIPMHLWSLDLLLVLSAVGALLCGSWFLPFTVAIVTGRRWPVSWIVGPTVWALLYPFVS